MVTAKCSHEGCNYVTPEGEAPVFAVQLQIHGMSHQGAVAGAGENIKKPDRLEIKTEMSETEWQELLHFWTRLQTRCPYRREIGAD